MAFVLGKSFESGPPWPVVALGALILSPVLAFAGYTFLRNDNLEPYRGRELLVRAAICGTVYAALWGAYALVPVEFKADMWWLYISPPFLFIVALAAFACFDLDLGTGFLHYSFYVLLTAMLALLMNVPIWVATTPPAVLGMPH